MQRWTTRFKLHVVKTGRVLHQAEPDISEASFLHHISLGILLLEGSSLTATANIVEALVAQWSEDEIARRDRGRGKAQAHAAAIDAWSMQQLEEALPEEGEEWPEEPVFEEELVAYGDGSEFYDPEDNEEVELGDGDEFDGETTDQAEEFAEQAFASASRTFQEARDLLAQVRSARGFFPVVGIGAYDGALPTVGKGKGVPKGKSRGGGGLGRGRGGKPSSTSRPPQQPPAPAVRHVTAPAGSPAAPRQHTRPHAAPSSRSA